MYDVIVRWMQLDVVMCLRSLGLATGATIIAHSLTIFFKPRPFVCYQSQRRQDIIS